MKTEDSPNIFVILLFAFLITQTVMAHSLSFFLALIGPGDGVFATVFKLVVIFPLAYWAAIPIAFLVEKILATIFMLSVLLFFLILIVAA